jgi:exodeoxyribonuclease V gamma subunit
MKSVRTFEKSNKFHLISSNRLEKLTADLAERMNTPCRDSVLIPETVIVQSRGMERYLRLALAESQGISANMEFPFPQKFISEYIFTPMLAGKKENALELGVFAWDIFDKLPELAENNELFKPLRSYLADDPDKIKTFQLSQRIANLFEQYLIFRPDIVRKWSFNDNPLKSDPQSLWQAELWRQVVPYQKGFNFSDLYWHFLKLTYPDAYGQSSLAQLDFEELMKQKRIFLFGFSAMAPVFLDLFFAVSKYIDVYFYYLNPCEAEWQYDLSERAKLHLSMKQALVEKADFQFDTELESGNPLLSSFGGQGREFFALLSSTDEEALTLFESPESDTLLHKVQRDIQYGEACPGEKFESPESDTLLHKVQRDIQYGEACPGEKIVSNDRSIQIHSCHTPMREVEVLFENLTAMFQADPTLLPKDVLVLTPDINTYSPYIEAVFKSRNEDDPRRFFITVADRSQAKTALEVETFLNILKITQSRFKASEVLAILETPVVSAAFGLDEKMVFIVRQWIIDARISWGIDGEFREQSVGLEFNEQSWKQGVERILAGFAFGSETENSDKIYKVGDDEILPFHCCEGESALLFGKLVDFLESLFALRLKLNTDPDIEEEAFTPGWWYTVLNDAIDKFFPSGREFSNEVLALREAVRVILDNVFESEYNDEVGFEIIYDELSNYFDKNLVRGGFLSGGITFCEARPLRSIPARIVCFLGMDEKSFPRNEKHLSFDLMAHKPRLGDRSARKDDRYLFLETLLSARDCFYVSYLGQGIKDNEPRLPSVVLCELLDYLDDSYHFSAGNVNKALVTVHPLQSFSWKYFIADSDKKRYSKETGVEIPDKLISYSSEDKELSQLKFMRFSEKSFLEGCNARIPEELYRISIEELGEFFSNPAKYFLQKCLQVYPQVKELPELADCESFEIDNLERYKIAEKIIKKYISRWGEFDKDKLKETLKKRFHAEGAIPLKSWGDIEFDKFYEDFFPFAESLSEKIKNPLESASGELHLANNVMLSGYFEDLYLLENEKHLIDFKYSKINGSCKKQIKASLNELGARAMEIVDENSKLTLIGRDIEKEFYSESCESARTRLKRLTEIYLEGLRRPLQFFPETSLAYIKGEAKGYSMKNALGKWESSMYGSGEGDDAYINCCFGKEFRDTKEFKQISKEIIELLNLNS